MRSWKRLIAMALAGVLAVGCAAGCGTAANTASQPETGSAASSSDTKQPIITVMTNCMGEEKQHMLQAGAILQGQELGYTINILAPNNADNTQEVVNDLAAAQTYSDAIVFMPNCDTLISEDTTTQAYLDQIVPALSDVRAAGIPVVLMSYDLDDDSAYDAFCGINRYRAGRALGDQIAEDQPGAVVGLLQLDSVTKSYKIWEKGIVDALQENGCTVLEEEAVAEWDFNTAVALSTTLMENHPDLTTFVCMSDWIAGAASKAIQKAGRQEILEEEMVESEQSTNDVEETEPEVQPVQVYAVSWTAGGMKNILGGSLKAEIFENPLQIGRDSITVADQLLKGQSVKKINRTPYVLVTQDNAQALIDEINAALAAAGLGGA